jgi:hypothetical protein
MPDRPACLNRAGLARGAACLAVALAALPAAGCGTGPDRAQARAAAERFYAAVASRDGRTACAQLSPDTRAKLVQDAAATRCDRAVLGLSLHGGRVAAVRVYATSAQVELAGGDTVFLGDSRQGWRIQAVGCRPKDGGPYECEAEA